LENIFNPQRARVHGYVRADADLHVGKQLIVVPDDALIEGEPAAHEGDPETTKPKTEEPGSHPWEERASAESTRSSIWTRGTDTTPRAPTQTPLEAGLKTETARAAEGYRGGEAGTDVSPSDREGEAVLSRPKDQSQA
jgi:hypothetical protein